MEITTTMKEMQVENSTTATMETHMAITTNMVETHVEITTTTMVDIHVEIITIMMETQAETTMMITKAMMVTMGMVINNRYNSN